MCRTDYTFINIVTVYSFVCTPHPQANAQISAIANYKERVNCLYIRSFISTTRRRASAVYAMTPCPSVSVKLGVLSKRLNEPSWVFLAWELRLIYSQVISKNKGTSPGTLPRTLDLENFATASRSRCQQNSSTVEFVDHDGRRVVAGRT